MPKTNATDNEMQEIVADMVRLFNLDENLMPDMQDKEAIEGRENFTDKENAEYWLGEATVIVNRNGECKNGVIFWGDCESWFSIITQNADDKLCLMNKDNVGLIYWGK